MNSIPLKESNGSIADLNPADVQALARELTQYCGQFGDVLPRTESRQKFQAAMAGLLSGLEKKNGQVIALKGGYDIPVRTMQYFLSSSPWSDEAVRIRHQELVSIILGHPEGLVLVDGSDFPKKGEDSAGVARQYCGMTGKTDNCQAGVFIAYAHPENGATLVDAQLYMPKKWFSEEQRKQRWEDCHIPEDLEFKTKPQLALDMVQTLHRRGHLPARWVLADEAFGNNPTFLDGIPKSLFYFCEVASNTRVWFATASASLDPEVLTHCSPTSESIEVRRLIAQEPIEWQTQVVLKEGAHGPLVADVARLRVTELRKDGEDRDERLPRNDVWLFLRRNPETGEVKYYLSNAPEDTPMDKMSWLSAMRWPIETCFQEGKDHLGMDHYQVRSWNGWHHHMTLVMLSHHFLVRVRTRLKKNSRNDPSPGPTAPGCCPPLWSRTDRHSIDRNRPVGAVP